MKYAAKQQRQQAHCVGTAKGHCPHSHCLPILQDHCASFKGQSANEISEASFASASQQHAR
eukprot:5016457-Amphidinium_carterae.1